MGQSMISWAREQAAESDVADLVDVPLHPTRETCFADWTTARGVFIARATSQTLNKA
jgi:hypothetical protein